jgi:hypothetical protein
MQQADVLASLFRATEGAKWKDAQGWKELVRNKRVTDQAPAHLLPAAGAAVSPSLQQQQQQQQQLSQRFLLVGLRGVRCDENSGEVLRINLSSNGLTGVVALLLLSVSTRTCKVFSLLWSTGHLPSSIGSLTSLTQLVLSDNRLGGEHL